MPTRRRWLAAVLLPLAAGCRIFSNANTEMNRITDTLPDGRGARHLIAFLPGAWDVAEDFQRFGFVSQVRDRGLAADIVAVDSHVGYFNNGSIAERVRDEVVTPAREAGYRSIWLVGISLGGLGSMLHASRHPGVDGIVALAPYLATRDVIAEVRQAGGLAAWAGNAEPAAGDWERRLLKWLAGYAGQAVTTATTAGKAANDATDTSGAVGMADVRAGPADSDCHAAPRPELILAYGLQDRFADSLSLLAPVLDPARVVTIDGGHEWDTWTRLWTMVLDRYAARLAPPLSRPTPPADQRSSPGPRQPSDQPSPDAPPPSPRPPDARALPPRPPGGAP